MYTVARGVKMAVAGRTSSAREDWVLGWREGRTAKSESRRRWSFTLPSIVDYAMEGDPASFASLEDDGRAKLDNPPFSMKPKRMGHPAPCDGCKGWDTRGMRTSKSKGKSEIRGFFAPLRMTRGEGVVRRGSLE
jgi:hypothetical protein